MGCLDILDADSIGGSGFAGHIRGTNTTTRARLSFDGKSLHLRLARLELFLLSFEFLEPRLTLFDFISNSIQLVGALMILTGLSGSIVSTRDVFSHTCKVVIPVILEHPILEGKPDLRSFALVKFTSARQLYIR